MTSHSRNSKTRTVLKNGTVVDGTGSPRFDADVAIVGDRIVEVAPGLTGDVIIDVAGRIVAPVSSASTLTTTLKSSGILP